MITVGFCLYFIRKEIKTENSRHTYEVPKFKTSVSLHLKGSVLFVLKLCSYIVFKILFQRVKLIVSVTEDLTGLAFNLNRSFSVFSCLGL